MTPALGLVSVSAIEPAAARPDPLEVGPRSTGAGRKAAVDRIPGNGISKEPLDRGMDLPNVHRAIRPRQDLDHRPLDHPVAQTMRPRSLRHRSVLASLIRKTRRKCTENPDKRWGMV
jgi:hypothetical protein